MRQPARALDQSSAPDCDPGFALNVASRALAGYYRRRLTEVGLTYTQYLVMLVVWSRGRVGVGEVGRALRLDQGTLSPVLRRLEEAELVERRRDEADGRRTTVSCTVAGKALRDRVEVLTRTGSGVECCDGQRERLARLLGEVLARLEGAAARGPGPEVHGATRAQSVHGGGIVRLEVRRVGRAPDVIPDRPPESPVECEPVRFALAASVFGALDAVEARGVEEHLEGCESCRVEREELSVMLPLLDTVLPHEMKGIPVPDVQRAIDAVRSAGPAAS